MDRIGVRPRAQPHQPDLPTLANAIVIMSAYLAAASLVWGFADASMDQPLDLEAFDAAPPGGRVWRVAHLSDIHIVGERYGFRIESGRGGPRGNERLRRVMARLEESHAARPLDLRAHHRRHDRRRTFGRMGGIFRHRRRAIPISPRGC